MTMMIFLIVKYIITYKLLSLNVLSYINKKLKF